MMDHNWLVRVLRRSVGEVYPELWGWQVYLSLLEALKEDVDAEEKRNERSETRKIPKRSKKSQTPT